MIILDSQVGLSSSRESLQIAEVSESISISNTVDDDSRTIQNSSGNDDNVEISAAAMAMQAKNIASVANDAKDGDNIDDKLSLKVSLIKMIIEKLTGNKLELYDPSNIEEEIGDAKVNEMRTFSNEQGSNRALRSNENPGLLYEKSTSYYESEKVSFSASALVKTADNKEINIELELKMAHEFESTESISIRLGGALKDPLVINFNGSAAELTESKFSFDIDMDGEKEKLSFVKPDSGFLALDKNRNSKIDDGSELFGAKTGDGFKELAEYDQDKNNWIDERDAIYQDLKIWSKDDEGNDQLIAMTDRGVGAIYLGNKETQFSLNDTQNQPLGQIRSTGIYVSEDGTAGTIQQVDLVI